MVYNQLSGDARKWAMDNKWNRAEYGARVVGKIKRPEDTALARVAGDGKHGFHTRHQAKDKSKISIGIDGAYIKAPRSRKPKNGCKLVSSKESASKDNLIIEQQAALVKSANRRARRNNSARRNRNANS